MGDVGVGRGRPAPGSSRPSRSGSRRRPGAAAGRGAAGCCTARARCCAATRAPRPGGPGSSTRVRARGAPAASPRATPRAPAAGLRPRGAPRRAPGRRRPGADAKKRPCVVREEEASPAVQGAECMSASGTRSLVSGDPGAMPQHPRIGVCPEHLPVIRRLLIANRGEIAVRLVRAAADSGIESVVALLPTTMTTAAPSGLATRAVAARRNRRGRLPRYRGDGERGEGETGCHAIPSGLRLPVRKRRGSPAPARGPTKSSSSAPGRKHYDLFGDKERLPVVWRKKQAFPLARGTQRATSLQEAREFLEIARGRRAGRS